MTVNYVEGVLRKNYRKLSTIQVQGAEGYKIKECVIRKKGEIVSYIPENNYCYLKAINATTDKNFKIDESQFSEGIEVSVFKKLLTTHGLTPQKIGIIYPFIYSRKFKFSHTCAVFLV